MRKTRLYLEASPIIRVDDNNNPIRQAITKEFFRIVAEKTETYELFISPVTVRGVGKTAPLVATRTPHNAPLRA